MTNFLTLLQYHTGLLYTVTIIVGLCVGSFLNVVIYRLPVMLNNEWRQQCLEWLPKLVPYRPVMSNKTQHPTFTTFNLCLPTSHCPSCNTPLKAWQNIPLLSYVLLRGRCAHCRQAIAWRYPAVECITALLSLMVIVKFGATGIGFCGLIFCYSLIALTVIDLEHQLLPDVITLPLLWFGLLMNLQDTFTILPDAVISAAVAYLLLWILIKLFYFATGKIGMGQGDFKLYAAFGAWFGWQLLPFILIIASLIGAIVGIILLKITKQSKDTPIPFGPFLALAGIIILFWGPQLLELYVRWVVWVR